MPNRGGYRNRTSKARGLARAERERDRKYKYGTDFTGRGKLTNPTATVYGTPAESFYLNYTIENEEGGVSVDVEKLVAEGLLPQSALRAEQPAPNPAAVQSDAYSQPVLEGGSGSAVASAPDVPVQRKTRRKARVDQGGPSDIPG